MELIQPLPFLWPHDAAGNELQRGAPRARVDDGLGQNEQWHAQQKLRVGGKVGEEIRRRATSSEQALPPRQHGDRNPGQEDHECAALEQTKARVLPYAQRRVEPIEPVALEQGKRGGIDRSVRRHGYREIRCLPASNLFWFGPEGCRTTSGSPVEIQ